MANRRRPHRRCKLYVGMQCDFANHCDAVVDQASGHRVLVRRCSHYMSAKKWRRRKVHGTRAG